ncbi:MAG TPA: HAMP domain-containing sensor histidine kinase [Propionibacteriaceae bacterium]|nr:HAMP domain-containing sensor histidine kinase [Propionibacteriaceae bacterium]
MRRQIVWLVAATTSVVVLAFVLPLALLIQSFARVGAMAAAQQEAQGAELLITSLHDDARLPDLLARLDSATSPSTSVVTPTGAVYGAPISLDDPDVRRGRAGTSYDDAGRPSGGVVVRSVMVQGIGTFVVVTRVSRADLMKGVWQAWVTVVAIGVGLTVISVVAASVVVRRMSGPLREVASVAHQLRSGNLSARAEPVGAGETRELAEALNGLAERIRELLAAERAAVGEMAHRLRTPITALRLDAEAIADPELSARLNDHLTEVQRAVDTIVKEARRGVRDDLVVDCDATEVIRERVAFWSALAEDQDRPFHQEVPDGPLRVQMPESDLVDLIDICIDNVFAHTAEGVAFGVTLSRSGDSAVVVIADEGPGFQEHVSQRGSDVVGRTGVGLEIVEKLVRGLGGTFRTSPPGLPGATVAVSLPLAG